MALRWSRGSLRLGNLLIRPSRRWNATIFFSTLGLFLECLVHTQTNGAMTASLAAYRYDDVNSPYGRKARLILMQHGSYYIGDIECQPLVDRGEAVLYRGIQNTETHLLHRLATEDIRARFMDAHAPTISRNRLVFFGGTPGTIRTCDLLLRRQTLYPSELRAPIAVDFTSLLHACSVAQRFSIPLPASLASYN